MPVPWPVTTYVKSGPGDAGAPRTVTLPSTAGDPYGIGVPVGVALGLSDTVGVAAGVEDTAAVPVAVAVGDGEGAATGAAGRV